MASDDSEYVNLEELGGSKFEIVDGEPNIKGWDVRNEQDEDVGEVEELLFDPKSLKVRYLVVLLNSDDTGLQDKKVLIPIGIAELVQSDNYVRLNHVSVAQLNSLPEYNHEKLCPDTERIIRNIFESEDSIGINEPAVSEDQEYDRQNFYKHKHFNEDKFYNQSQNKVPVIEENLEVGKQEVSTGTTRIRSKIIERPVEGTVNLREEHVSIERKPVNRPVTDADVNAFKEQVIEITEHAEVPVVSKEVRVVEEITIKKEVEHREETIRETVRRTEVESEKINPSGKDNL